MWTPPPPGQPGKSTLNFWMRLPAVTPPAVLSACLRGKRKEHCQWWLQGMALCQQRLVSVHPHHQWKFPQRKDFVSHWCTAGTFQKSENPFIFVPIPNQLLTRKKTGASLSQICSTASHGCPVTQAPGSGSWPKPTLPGEMKKPRVRPTLGLMMLSRRGLLPKRASESARGQKGWGRRDSQGNYGYVGRKKNPSPRSLVQASHQLKIKNSSTITFA